LLGLTFAFMSKDAALARDNRLATVKTLTVAVDQ
jgi:hypothetical protein